MYRTLLVRFGTEHTCTDALEGHDDFEGLYTMAAMKATDPKRDLACGLGLWIVRACVRLMPPGITSRPPTGSCDYSRDCNSRFRCRAVWPMLGSASLRCIGLPCPGAP